MVVVALGSLTPFKFAPTALPLGSLLDGFQSVELSFPDTPINIFIYVPIGFALLLAMGAHLRRPVRWMLVILGAAAFSFLLECSQLFVAERFASWADVLSNTLGASAGVILADRLTRRLAYTWAIIQDAPPLIAWRALHIILLATLAGLGVLGAIGAPNLHGAGRLAATGLSGSLYWTAPIFALTGYAAISGRRKKPRAWGVGSILVCGVAAAGFEVLQSVSALHTARLGDFLANTGASALGVAVAMRASSSISAWLFGQTGATTRGARYAGLTVLLLMLAAAPAALAGFGNAGPKGPVQFELFETCWRQPFMAAFAMLFEECVMFSVLSFALVLLFRLQQRSPMLIAAVVAGVALAGEAVAVASGHPMELGSIIIAALTADVTARCIPLFFKRPEPARVAARRRRMQ